MHKTQATLHCEVPKLYIGVIDDFIADTVRLLTDCPSLLPWMVLLQLHWFGQEQLHVLLSAGGV